MKPLFSRYDMRALAEAISDSLHNAFKHPTFSEPQLVANLVWELPKQINKLRPSGKTKVSAGGVFVHARPLVTCTSFPKTSPASVEIGDLLLIRTLVVDKKVVERRALLLQAKKADSIPAVPDNQNQWHLYEQWPQFTYAARSGRLKGQSRHVTEPDMYDAAKYLLIGSQTSACHWSLRCIGWPFYLLPNWPDICYHHTAQPTKTEISRYRCFAGELLDFLVGNAGKVFIDPPPSVNGWHQVIHDLIEETKQATSIFMGRATGQTGKSARGTGRLFMAPNGHANFFLVADAKGTGDSNDPPEGPNEWLQGNDGSGISVIEVIVEQSEG